MLLKDFYTLISKDEVSDGNHAVAIRVNAQHEVFKGHFPGNPVMPGVCMMQIIKELTEEIIGQSLFMQSLSNVKFMALINPDVTPDLRLELNISQSEEGLVKVKNTTYFNDTVALKLSSTYKKV
ncbi:3-hydroxyacyl-ACP dehydratase FabZ family protein [Flavobacterium selenitireducens]|uniref:3-hydroxyacyl-ACP dehydratase FabZ family protein n=1 Tax=Flavobacterium selenitireducens TaxID=2722704 RepID=UPI00168BECB2|nr:3-hydroxyacyl-ACP dehydratase [Flavobacterium selenitireducens]MBD3582178.1 3-hydroxyacyl-ACP dehydratase [Flavobacterium selenitireducens]